MAASVARLSTTEFERVAAGAANDTAPSIGEPGRVFTSARSQAGSVRVDAARATAREPMPVAAAPVPSSAPVAQRSASGEVARVEQTARGVGGPTDLASGSAPVAGGSAERSDVVVQSAPAASSTTTTPAPAPPAAAPENVEQLVRKLYGPLVRRIKAELLLDRERRGIRIDGI